MGTEAELTPVSRPCGLYREYIKGEIKKIILSEDILINISIDWYGHPVFSKQTWHKYWEPVTPLLSPLGLNTLENLRKARRKYIRTRFSHETMMGYCFSYFCLLVEVLNNPKITSNNKSFLNLLSRILGFENFTIRWASGSAGLACGTSTTRNPCYLLAKIKQPQTNDDPKFLAIITSPNIAHSEKSRLFYHYRQHKIDGEFGISLLLYPAAALSERANSFTLIESLTSGFSDKTDPRSKQRSQILADSAISPFLTKLFSKTDSDFAHEVNFVDIGSGNGALVSNIWRQMIKIKPHIAQNYKLACSMVGLRVQNPLRHFNKGSLRGTISYLDYSQTDYLQWLQEQKLTHGDHKFDVALICRLLNNLSKFELSCSNDWRVIHKLGDKGLGKTDWLNRRFDPHNCLNPDNLSAKHIFLKNSNVSLLKFGKSFRHLSLSNYYKGLQLLCNNGVSRIGDSNAVYFPIRRFNPASLQLPNGKSSLEKLCNLAKLVVIEDVDLTKKDLIRHLVEFDLENIAASHVNKHNRLNSASIFCLCKKELADLLPGKKIWPDLLQKIENQLSSRLRNCAAFQKSRQST
jgi:hypothetical protein